MRAPSLCDDSSRIAARALRTNPQKESLGHSSLARKFPKKFVPDAGDELGTARATFATQLGEKAERRNGLTADPGPTDPKIDYQAACCQCFRVSAALH